MAEQTFDILVIGGGPGGYVAAIRAAQLGFRTAVIEEKHLGGICLNWGCIPTKALLRSAEIYHYMKHANAYGLSAGDVGFDLAKVVQRSRGVSKRLNGGVGHLLKKNRVTVIDGHAELLGGGKIAITRDGERLDTMAATHIIIATGARPRALPGLEADGKRVWSYFEAMVPEQMPKSLLVIGTGAIGVEFASFYRTMGAEVTLVEVLPQILPAEDAEISAFARKQFEKQGIVVLSEAKVSGLGTQTDSVTARIETAGGEPRHITVDRVISAVGVVGNVEGIGLENTGVVVDRNTIVADGYGRTAEPGVYAIGDVAGPPMLAHKAEHEGVICVEAIAGLKGVHPMNRNHIPGCTYCHPQIAGVGLTEARAREAGLDLKIGRFPFIGNGKALALGESDGLVKTIFNAATGELLGAHMVGAEVTELIQGFVVAMGLETTEEELMHTAFPHPTLSEMMHESVLGAYGRAIHI